MSELESKKKLLAAECDVYREMLRLELHNVRLYGTKAKQNLTSAGLVSPLLMTLLPWATGRRGFGVRELGALALLGWRWYRRFNQRGFWFGGSRADSSSAEELPRRNF